MKVITDYKSTLSQNITSTQATIPVSSLATADDTPHTITAADFDSMAFLVIEPGGANQEIVSVTGTDSTPSFTGATRGLAFYGGTTTTVSGNRRSHQAGSTVIMTNAHYYYDELVDLSSAETITGIKTFATGATPLITDAPTTPTMAANKAYADSLAIAGAPNASTSVQGLVQQATTAQVNAGTATGSTGAKLFASPADLAASNYGTQLPTSGQKLALVGNNTDIAVGSGNEYVTQTGFQHNAEKYALDNSGSSTAYTVALSPVPTSLTSGMVVYAKLVNANTTTTPTLNVNSLGAKTIVKQAGSALVAGDIAANQYCSFIYDLANTRWVYQSPVGTTPATATFGSVANQTGLTVGNTDTVVTHSLGATPTIIVISAFVTANSTTNVHRAIGTIAFQSSGSVAYGSCVEWNNSGVVQNNGAGSLSASGAADGQAVNVTVVSVGATTFTLRIVVSAVGAGDNGSTVTGINWTAQR